LNFIVSPYEIIQPPPSLVDSNQAETSWAQFQRLVASSYQSEPPSELTSLDSEFEIHSSTQQALEDIISNKGKDKIDNTLEDTATSLNQGEPITPILERLPSTLQIVNPSVSPTSGIYNFEQSAEISTYFRNHWYEQSSAVVQKLEDYLSPVRESLETSSISSNNRTRRKLIPTSGNLSNPFVRLSYKDNINPFGQNSIYGSPFNPNSSFINPYSYQHSPNTIIQRLEPLDGESSKPDSINFQEEEWFEDYNMAQPRPLNLVTLPQYDGYAGSDPDHHVNQFNIVCLTNMILEQRKLNTFPDTLIGIPQEWYQTNTPFDMWNALRDAFLTRF